MKITVHKERLQRVLGFVERVTSRNATLPILSNILLVTENGRLRVSATNLEVGVSSLIGAKVEQEGKIAVPAKTLSDFIRGVSEESISLELRQQTLSVRAGRYRTTILCFDASEYPIIPKIDGGDVFELPVEDLKLLIETVSDSIASTDSRPELAGAFLRFDTNGVTMAATDIFRLAEHSRPGVFTRTATAIIPRGAIHELGRILGGIEGMLQIRLAENQVSFSHDEFEVISRLIDGKYPDYKKIIPEHSLARVLVRRDEIENAAKVAALFSSSISDIKIECSSEEISISGKNSSKGEAFAGVESNLKGESFDVSMNFHYFLDGLKVIPSDKVVMEYTGKGSPFVLRPNADDTHIVYLIMPLRN
ncbi:MAG: DNA polymerase III subunit beta [Candidatus Pacebacteria bacterium]|nr:DNA polymerase III subunit beta [Candidatus Paceibacterota bacterium]